MTTPEESIQRAVGIIGGGPAGLMTAEVLLAGGARVHLYERMPSVARKLLMAGKGGLNITHAEALDRFHARYTNREHLEPMLHAFGPQALRAWVHELGIQTFVGTSGRIFPHEMKAAPLVRAWLHRLRESGLSIHVRHEWRGWTGDGALRFATAGGEKTVQHAAVVLALGGASWPQLGSDGRWVQLLAERGIGISPLRPANCGFDVAWSEHFRTRHAGKPVKPVVASFTDAAGTQHRRQGEFVITDSGVEGSLIYALSAALRDEIARKGTATLTLDLAPGQEETRLAAALGRPRGSRSIASHIQSRIGLKGVKTALLREALPYAHFEDLTRLAPGVKALPLTLLAPRPLHEAISTAGGIEWDALDERLMLRKLPGVFCAGEMLDWEAPTGGYLLTACFALGRAAGRGVLTWLSDDQ
jgi:uncharacterized flavoprotein (TIGR03862 family)